MKKPIPNKQARSNFRESALWIIAAILVVLQGISLTYIAKMHDSISEESKQDAASLVNSAEEKRYKYPVIDVSAGRVYIPEARIYLPLNATSRDIRYNLFDVKGSEAIYFSLPIAIGRQTEVDDASCDKMVALTQSKTPGPVGMFVSETQPTQDGMRYIFRHAPCQIYPDSTSKDLAGTVSQLQNY